MDERVQGLLEVLSETGVSQSGVGICGSKMKVSNCVEE